MGTLLVECGIIKEVISMNSDDLFSYLVATDQVDEFFGNNILKCPYCKSTLYVYEDNIMYCDKCDELIWADTDNLPEPFPKDAAVSAALFIVSPDPSVHLKYTVIFTVLF